MREQLKKIILVYELASTMLTPKSYNWKEVAKKMYEIANQPIKESK